MGETGGDTDYLLEFSVIEMKDFRGEEYSISTSAYLDDEGKLEIHTDCPGFYGFEDLQINFCPMCGRKFKLKDKTATG